MNNGDNVLAAEEDLAHQNVRTVVLDEVALRRPVVFDVFNLTCMVQVNCGQLSVAMLRSIREHFDLTDHNFVSTLFHFGLRQLT